MANKVLLKKSSTVAKVPATSDLDYGEIALNYADGKLYFKNSSNVVQSFGSTSFTRVTSNTTAIAGKKYICDTTAGVFTLTLPASPVTGDTVVIGDGGSFYTNNLTVGRNSSTIDGITDDLALNIAGIEVTLVYDGTTWQVYTQIGASGGTEVTLAGTQTLTNKTISGSSNTLSNIGNSSLTNSSISINGSAISLGGSVSSLVTLTGNETLTNKTLTTPVVDRLDWAGAGTGAPAFTTRSSGTKLLLYPAISGSQVDYAVGINSATLWSSVPVSSSDFYFKWYGGQTQIASLDGVGNLTVNRSISVPGGASVTANSATDKYLNIGTHGQLFDDGNFHIHSSDGALWLNSLNGSDINIGLQSNSGASKLQTNNISMDAGYGSRAPIYGVRAWISCGYIGSTMVTNASGNLSVSRVSAGKYAFTFGTEMPDGNYSVTATAKTPFNDSDVAANLGYNIATTTTGFTIHCARYGTGYLDVPQLCVQVVR